MGPLTFSQRRIWLRDQLREDATGLEFDTIQVRFIGQIRSEALRCALAECIRRHSILRTTFHSDGGDPYQKIWNAPVRPVIAEIDLSDAPPLSLERNIDEIVAAEARNPFNLARGPLGRCVLIKRSDGNSELLLTLHRIAFDDSSIGILADELSALYAAEVEGRSLPQPTTHLQFVDVALQEYRSADAANVRERLACWQRHLDGASARVELQADFMPPSDGTGAAKRIRVPLGAAVTENLVHAATSYAVPVHVPLIAAWAVTLSRFSAQSGVVMGLLLPHRRLREFAAVVGPLDDVVPLHVRDCDHTTVANIVEQVASSLGAIERLAYTPPEWIVQAAQGGLSEGALHQVMVRVETRSEADVGTRYWNVEVPRTTWLQAPSFEMALNIRCVGSAVSAELFYAPHRFAAHSVRRIAAGIVRVLRGMLDDSQGQTGRLPLLSNYQQRRVVVGLNSRQHSSRREQNLAADDRLLHKLFEKQVHRRPEDVALVCGNMSVTYGELNARANRLAYYLRSTGLTPDGRVAICLERGVEMIVAMLGVLKAGGAYVPLDPSYPAKRLHHILGDSGAVALIARGSFREMCDDIGLRLIDPWRRSDRAAIAECPEANPRRRALGVQPSNLAYVIYTSGSTGEPKGVLVEHTNVVSATVARHNYYGPVGRWLLISPISFDSSVAVVFGALTSGGTLVVATDELARDSRKLALKIASCGIECVLAVPEFLRQILDELAQAGSVPSALRLITAGDVCPRSLVESARTMGLALFNEYGPTEATVWATVHDCRELPSQGSVPIGHPIDTARIYVLDSYQTPVPAGVVGEIYIGGQGIARGYMNRPELSDERFMPDPFDLNGVGRMYRTGDLGRWLPSGHLEFCGRRDLQVKVRGYRIELEEIEAHLADVEGIDGAAVAWDEEDATPRRLVAYVACADQARFQPKSLHELLSRRMPSFMVPSAYVRLDALPVTHNGKVDRASLPKAAARSAARSEYSAPRGPAEENVAAMWTKLLGVPRLGRRDNFFQLGGDSLSAAKIVEMCSRRGVRVSVHDLFKSPTLMEFARLLRAVKRQRVARTAKAASLNRAGYRTMATSSSAQAQQETSKKV